MRNRSRANTPRTKRVLRGETAQGVSRSTAVAGSVPFSYWFSIGAAMNRRRLPKMLGGGIVILAVAVGGFVWAGAGHEKSLRSPGTGVAAAAGGVGDPAKNSPQAASGPAQQLAVSASSQPANANSPTAKPTNKPGEKNAAAALKQAADAKKHLFVFVREKDDEQTREGRKTFDAAVGKLGDTVRWIAINRSDASESEFVEKHGLQAAPMPLALCFAPNGVIVGGFVGANLTEQNLLDALASPALQVCMKALQERKLVFLCAQNSATKSNDAAMKGVNEFKGDTRFAQFTEIVRVDPSDAAEKKFLTRLQVDPKTNEAATVFLAPPGSVIGKFSGATDMNTLVATLQKASSGGCGPKGCGPKK